jgi:adenylate kinase
MDKLLFLGPPGCGKGTQASMLKKFGYLHVSSGDILRNEISNNTQLGLKVKQYVESGGLVPDDIMIEVIMNSIPIDKFILDGFPRTETQAVSLDESLKFDLVINFQCDTNMLVDRILNRMICPSCNKSYSNTVKCVDDNTTLIKRSDDDITKALKRINTYNNNIEALSNFYANKILNIDATKDINEINYNLCNAIGLFK